MSKEKTNNYCNPMQDAVLWGLFFEKLLEHVAAEVMVADSYGDIVFVNNRFLDFFGYPLKDTIGANWITRTIPKKERGEIKSLFRELKKERMLSRFDTPVEGHEGVKKYLHWIVVPLKDQRTYYYMFIGKAGKYEPKGEVVKHELTDEKLQTEYRGIVDALFTASKVSEPGTAQHAYRVMAISVLLAKKYDLGKEAIERLKIAALLHDLGKLAVDEKILFKNGKLTKQEFEEMKKHPHWGAEVVRLVCFLQDIIPIMASHHENFDGSGYPIGIEGEQIPFEARLLSVADMYEALTADRPYRKGFTVGEAAVIIRSERGRKLDPEITDVLLEMIDAGELDKEGF